MALQGTIDSFPLTDVLTLLASSKKTGRLALEGDRGSAALWIAEGEVIGGDMVGVGDATAASLLFEMLRYSEASFAFDAAPSGSTPQYPVTSTPLEVAMESAATLLAEWDEIVAVVPSLAHRVLLVEALPTDSVTLDAVSWSLVVAAAADPVVAVIGDALGLDEFGACAAAASLVERGLATIAEPLVGEPAPAGSPFDAVADRDAEQPVADELSDAGLAAPEIDLVDRSADATDPERAEPEFPDRFPIDDLLGGDASDADEAWRRTDSETRELAPSFDGGAFDGLPPLVAGTPDAEPSASGPDAWDALLSESTQAGTAHAEAARAETAEESDDSTDEVLRQMSKLSPQAAEAIAAALSSVPATAPSQQRSATPNDAEGEGDGPVTFSGMF